MICPYCQSFNTHFNTLFSYMNGSSEIWQCESCGHTWELEESYTPDDESPEAK